MRTLRPAALLLAGLSFPTLLLAQDQTESTTIGGQEESFLGRLDILY